MRWPFINAKRPAKSATTELLVVLIAGGTCWLARCHRGLRAPCPAGGDGTTSAVGPGAPTLDRAVRGLALFGVLTALFGEVHPFCDQWLQSNHDAICKDRRGRHLVYADGVAVGEETHDRTGQPTMTATRLGRRSWDEHQ